MAKCRFCGAEIPDDSVKCPDCLAVLVEQEVKGEKTKKGKK